MTAQESRLLISIDARNAERQAQQLSRELQNITGSGERAERQTGALGSSLKSLAGYMAGIVSVGSAISKMDTYTGLQNRLKLVTNSQQELNGAMNDTFRIAQNTAQSWESVAQVYQRFADNAKSLGISLQQTASLTETVSKAIAVSGASAASADAALVQFGQALASGVLRGEEFNSIAEQAPALLKAIATGLDVNIGQLRKMAADGKLTGDVVISSLEKAKVSVDELFGKTDFTIANSFTQLNNAVTQFIGEAGKANGSASMLSDTIKALAMNLDTVANVATIGGIGLLTKAILTQAVAVQSSIAQSTARRVTMLAELQATTQVTTAEVARTGAIAEHTAMQLADARATMARMAGMQRLAYLQTTVLPLEQANTAATAAHAQATAADTVAQNANNAARSRGAMLLSAIGGPVGAIAIGVTALAAGYMYMSSKAKEANQEIERQAEVANQTAEELKKLNGLERDKAIDDMTESLKRQNQALSESSSTVNMQLEALKRVYAGNADIVKVVDDATNGTISMTDALEKFNAMKVDKQFYEQFKKNAGVLIENTEKATNTQSKLASLGVQSTLTGNQAQNAAIKHDMQANAIAGVGSAASNTTSQLEKLKAMQAGVNAEIAKGQLWQRNVQAGGKDWADSMEQFRTKYGIGSERNLTKEELSLAQQQFNVEQQRKKTLEQISASQKSSASSASQKSSASSARAAASASKAAARQQIKDDNEQNRLLEERKRLWEELDYQYSNSDRKAELDYEREIAKIQKAGFSDKTQKEFMTAAKNRYEASKKLTNMEYTYDLIEFKLNEYGKLKYESEMTKEKIRLNSELNDEQKKALTNAENEKFNIELANIRLLQEQRMFEAQQSFMTETDYINRKYELEEQGIMQKIDLTEREHLLSMNRLKKQTEQQERLNKATIAMQGMRFGGATQTGFEGIEVARNESVMASEELFQAELAKNLENREALYAQHNERVAEINKQANQAMFVTQMGFGERITASFADMFQSQQDEQSGAYKVMFAASKAFAIAQSLVSIQQGIAMASANAFPYNLAAMASVAAATASIVGNIKSVADVGFSSGGYTGNMGVGQVAGVVHGQEYVLNAQATKRVGVDTLNAINSGSDFASGNNVKVEPKIIINTPPNMTAEKSISQDGTVTIDIVDQHIAGALSNPNSKISKALKQNMNVSQRR